MATTAGHVSESLVSGDVYRPLRRADCDAIARHYNRNLAERDPLWCAGGRAYDGNQIWLHRMVLLVRGRGQAICQVHERDGRIISYFGGYMWHDQVTFSIGVVDLDLPDAFETWREDVTHLFGESLAAGAQIFRVQASTDRARFVDWLEREVGMERVPGRNLWLTDRAVIADYLSRRGELSVVQRPCP